MKNFGITFGLFFIAILQCSAQNARVVCTSNFGATYCNIYNTAPVQPVYEVPAIPQYTVDPSSLYLQQMYLLQLQDETQRYLAEAAEFREALRLLKEREALEQERKALEEYRAWLVQRSAPATIPPR